LKICFIVDARSPIARNWIRHFIASRHDVQIISTYPGAQAMYADVIVHEAPVMLAGFSRVSRLERQPVGVTDAPRASVLSSLKGRVVSQLSLAAQHAIMPLDLPRQARTVRRLIARLAPDVIHAMRIPFEGILAAKAAPPDVPLLISVWGNDFTLWASRNPLIARQTRRALQRADGLHTDCHRDLQMAIRDWGFKADKPARVLPGAGGIQTSLFHPGAPDAALRERLNIAIDAPVIINPRGARGYVCNDAFFQAIPAVLRAHPHTVFLCSAMQGNAAAEKWISQLQIQANVRLLPPVPRDEMAEIFRLAVIAVSPSLHDGTPNTLLEAMASGCFPVAGDIESVREWITDAVNGLLCDPTKPDELARAMTCALDDAPLRNAARAQNLQLIAERAEYNQVMQQAEAFYEEIIERKGRGL
jgi:glycosyltransferase involved in cell wall biosynthesis